MLSEETEKKMSHAIAVKPTREAMIECFRIFESTLGPDPMINRQRESWEAFARPHYERQSVAMERMADALGGKGNQSDPAPKWPRYFKPKGGDSPAYVVFHGPGNGDVVYPSGIVDRNVGDMGYWERSAVVITESEAVSRVKPKPKDDLSRTLNSQCTQFRHMPHGTCDGNPSAPFGWGAKYDPPAKSPGEEIASSSSIGGNDICRDGSAWITVGSTKIRLPIGIDRHILDTDIRIFGEYIDAAIAEAVRKEQGRWQDAICNQIINRVDDFGRIDGSGSESGDPLNATLIEINQGMDVVGEDAEKRGAAKEREAIATTFDEIRAAGFADKIRARGAQ